MPDKLTIDDLNPIAKLIYHRISTHFGGMTKAELYADLTTINNHKLSNEFKWTMLGQLVDHGFIMKETEHPQVGAKRIVYRLPRRQNTLTTNDS